MAFEKIVFAMKTWKDKVSGNTPVTAAELNRIEKGISDCAKQTNALGDSVSPISYESPCAVHFLNADNRLGLRLTDPSTTNSAIIAVTTENKLTISFKVNGEWLTKVL